MTDDFFQGRKVLVTGGAGFIGGHIAEALLARGAKVRVTMHRRPGVLPDGAAEEIQADLANPEDASRAVQGMDCVIHAAGAVSGAGVGALGAMEGIATNLVLTARIVEAAWKAGVERLLLFGSSTGYPLCDAPLAEDMMWRGPVPEAYFGYGWMRRYLERLGEFAAGRSGLRVALVRPTAVFGPRDDFDPRTGHVAASLIRRAVEREDPFVVWGTGEEQRDFLHVRDLAAGALLALEKKADADPVNIGRGAGVSIRALAEMVLAAAGHKVTPVFDPTRPVTVAKRVADVAKARRELGFAPRVPLAEGIAETVAWYRANRSL